MALTQTQVSQLYISILGRASEGNGNTFWQAASDMDTAATSMLDSAAAQAYFGTSLDTNQAFVEHIYTNTLGKAAGEDPTGIAFWVAALDGGMAKGDLVASMIDAVMLPANAGKTAQDLFINKVAVSDYCADTIPATDPSDLSAFTGYITSVTADASSVDTVKATIDTDAQTPGETFALTAGVDTPVLSANADTIEGVSSALVSEATLNATDVIDGLEGADTLKVDMKSNFSGFTTGSVKNVETVELSNATSIVRSFDATGVTGATKYVLDSAKGINLVDLDSTGLTVAVDGAQSNTSIAFATGVTLTGTTDAMTLELNGVGAAKTDSAAQVNPSITLGSIEEVTVSTNTAASFVDLSTVSALKTLTIKGDQALTVSDVGTTLTSVDGSAATGALTLGLSVAGTGGTVTSVTTGTGDDVVTIDAKDLQANAVVSGGAGTDTLKLADTAAAGSTLQLTQTGFEALQITGVATGQTLTMSASNSTDLSTVQLDANSVANGAVALVNTGSSNYTVNVAGGAHADQDLSIDTTGTVTANVEATAAQATAAVKTTGATTTSASDVTASNAATAVFTVGQYMTQSADFIANKATSVTLNVDSGKNTATTPAELTVFSGDLDAATAASVVVNADGKLDGAEINAVKATSAVINTGTTASTADLIVTAATDLQLTAKGDFTALAAASDLAKVQSATLATDGALIVDTALSDLAVMNLSGSNTKSSFDNNAKAVGSATMDHTMIVTATGLKAGFTLDGAIASAQAVSIDSSAVTGTQAIGTSIVGSDVTLTSSGAVGAVTYGTVDAKTDASGTLAINAVGNTNNLVVGTVGATTQHKTVSIDASGILGTVTVGAIKSDGAVTVNAANSLKAVAIGDATANGTDDITAVTGVTLTAGLDDLDLDIGIENSATSSAFTGVVTGSIAADTFDFDINNDAKSSVTLSGDLGLDTDAISVDATAVTTNSNAVTIDISGLTNYDAAALTGGAGVNTIKGGAGVDTIIGDAAADTFTGGAGADIFTFAADDSVAGTALDVITDFNTASASDVIKLAATATVLAAETDGTTATSDVDTSAGGVVTFAAADNTYALKVAAIQADTELDAAASVAIFEDGGNTYLYSAGALTGDTDDQIIQLTGVTALTAIAGTGTTDLTLS